MSQNYELLPDGLVTAPKDFLAGATYAGMKTYAADKMDLGILMSESPCLTAGMFTLNKVKSPSLVLTQQRVSGGKVKGVVVNSGIANACVGEQGMIDATEASNLAAQHVGMSPEEMSICSTGIIGVELPMALIRAGIPNIALSKEGGGAFARSILTTDRHPKSVAMRLVIDGTDVTIGGCVKGSGMIHPNMATMLAFLTSDAAIDPQFMNDGLKTVVDATFNMVTIDGDGSTNDSVLLMANAAAGNKPIIKNTKSASIFQEALYQVADYLARELVRDAEGSSKIFSVRVEGAQSAHDAQLCARAIAGSSLVKTAIHGNDPNWGRVIAAAGRSGAEIEERKVSFYINDVAIMENGQPIAFHKEAIIAIMQNPEVRLTVRLGIGDAAATAWGCELTEEYVNFNSAYTT